MANLVQPDVYEKKSYTYVIAIRDEEGEENKNEKRMKLNQL